MRLIAYTVLPSLMRWFSAGMAAASDLATKVMVLPLRSRATMTHRRLLVWF